MNLSILSQDFDKSICEAIDCNEKAVKTVEVNAGIYGKITLFLCNRCVDKFKKKEQETIQIMVNEKKEE